MSKDLLRHGLSVPDGAAAGTPVAVLLHGRGADRRDLLPLAPHLPEGTALVTPEAPHPGGAWGYGPGWAWYRYVAEDRVVPDTLVESLGALDGFLDALPDIVGFEPGPVTLGGFSQGGTTSLAWALSRPRRMAGVEGVAILSGFLVDDPTVPVAAERARNLRVFWGHGRSDTNIPLALAEKGRERLREAGVALTTSDHPGGHGIAPGEVEELARWMGAVSRPGGAPPSS